MSQPSPHASTHAGGHAIVLAAGLGTRMRSQLAKVLHPLLGRPMVALPVAAAQDAGLGVVVVVHHQEESVRAVFGASDGSPHPVRFARQEVPRGTGDAVAAGLDAIDETDGVVVVMAGDAPLVTVDTLTQLLQDHDQNLVTVVTARVESPDSYGRLVRDAEGRASQIVEAREATPDQLSIQEVNTGLYAFDLAWLRSVLPTLQPHAHKNEVYLTDTVQIAALEGRAGTMRLDDPDELMGVNDRWALSEAQHILQQRVLREHACNGVTFEDANNTRVELGVTLGQDVTIGPGAVIRSGCVVETGAVIGPHCVLINTKVGPHATLFSHTVCEGAIVGTEAKVGPFARLRPGTDLNEQSKVGNFVEVKKAVLEKGAKVNHLTYVGDAVVGKGANVGAGTITCNYDGYLKHKTEIGPGAFIGSNTALVAPVRVGEGAIIGAGSVVTRDVPDDAIAVGRGDMRVAEGAAVRYRNKRQARKKAAEAAVSSTPKDPRTVPE